MYVGITYTIGIKTNGTVWVWGLLNPTNSGTGQFLEVTTPIQLTTINNCKDVQIDDSYGGERYIKNDGTLWERINLTVAQIGTSTGFGNFVGTARSTIITKTDGTAWGKGQGNNGEFGNGTNVNLTNYTLISSNLSSNAIVISKTNFGPAPSMNYYVKQDGTLWGTGAGILGDGTQSGNNRYIFTQVGTLNIWKYISVNPSDSKFAIQTNGSLWVCGGDNNFGHLGLGDNNSSTQKLSFTLMD